MAEQDGLECLAGLSTELAEQYIRSLVQAAIQITCNDPAVPKGYGAITDGLGAVQCASNPGACTVAIAIGEYDSLSDAQLEQLVFHELLHASGLLHFLGDGTTDPDDQVYACARECFPKLNPGGSTLEGDASRCIGEYCPADTVRTSDGCAVRETDGVFPCGPEHCDGKRFPDCYCEILGPGDGTCIYQGNPPPVGALGYACYVGTYGCSGDGCDQ
jgi:hypothetical protein